MNNAFVGFPLLRLLNTLLLAGILATLVLILLRVREPISVQEPIRVLEPVTIGGCDLRISRGNKVVTKNFLRRIWWGRSMGS